MRRQVTGCTGSGTTIAAYTYDAEGRKITQIESGTTTDLYYSDRWQVIEEDVSGSATVQFTWGPFYVNQLIASDTLLTELRSDSIGSGGGHPVINAGRSYAEQDADWDVTSMTTDGGAVRERYRYDANGNVTVMNPAGTVIGAGMNSSTIGQVIGYQGGWTDPVTGLVTFQYRDLNTGLGRWLQQDPDGYQFELSSSPSGVDPTGNQSCPCPLPGLGPLPIFVGNPNPQTIPVVPPPAPPPPPAQASYGDLLAQGLANAANGLTNFFSDLGNSILSGPPPNQLPGANPLADGPLNPYNPFNQLPLPNLVPAVPRPDWSNGLAAPEPGSDHSTSVNIGEFGWGCIWPWLGSRVPFPEVPEGFEDPTAIAGQDPSPQPSQTAPIAKPIDQTRPQHGTPEHDATAYNKADDWQSDAETVPGSSRFNQNLVDPNGNLIPGFRPDAQRVRILPDGQEVVDIVEVQSPSQSSQFMDNKVAAMKSALGNYAGNINWVPPSSGAVRH